MRNSARNSGGRSIAALKVLPHPRSVSGKTMDLSGESTIFCLVHHIHKSITLKASRFLHFFSQMCILLLPVGCTASKSGFNWMGSFFLSGDVFLPATQQGTLFCISLGHRYTMPKEPLLEQTLLAVGLQQWVFDSNYKASSITLAAWSYLSPSQI